MSDVALHQSITALLNGSISEAEHQLLQNRLKDDASARAIFRERMDLEAGLRTWAADEGVHQIQVSDSGNRKSRRTKWLWQLTLIATAASILTIAVLSTQRGNRDQIDLADQQIKETLQEPPSTSLTFGKWISQAECDWQQPPSLNDGVLRAGMIKLTSGVAELRFDSGTTVVLEGPCELAINTADSARLLAGTVFVNVAEVSNGFLLETPESQIIDEGTQYAVTLDAQATEVHVFDGSVIWTSTTSDTDFEERIATGEARRYLRGEPARSGRVPFGQRQFVRRIEKQIRETASGDLIAYDGFENLAGKLRRDRSGFGWAGGWHSAAGFGRGKLAEVIDAPPGMVFGVDRSGRRLLSLQGGESMRRQFEKPIELSPGETIFVSLLISRQTSQVPSSSEKPSTEKPSTEKPSTEKPSTEKSFGEKSFGESPSGEELSGNRKRDEQSAAIQIVLEPDSASPRFARRHSVSFGIKSDQRLFLNNSGTIDENGIVNFAEEPQLFVLVYKADSKTTTASLRVYSANELIDETQPELGSFKATSSDGPKQFASLRISLGGGASAQIDELRVSNSWNAAADFTK